MAAWSPRTAGYWPSFWCRRIWSSSPAICPPSRTARMRTMPRGGSSKRHGQFGFPRAPRFAMRLHDPWALALLALVPLLWWLQRHLQRDAAVRFPSLTVVRAIPYAGARRWRWLLPALRGLGLLLLALALARPQKGKAE